MIGLLQRQIDFICDRVVDKEKWQDYERLALYGYANDGYESTYFNTLHRHQDVVIWMSQSSQNYESPVLGKAISWDHPSPDHDHLIIFVSKMNATILNDTRDRVKEALDDNVTITMIAMGEGAPASLVQQLDPRIYVIEWNIEEEAEPADWDQHAWRAFACSMLIWL